MRIGLKYAKFCEILLIHPKFWGTPTHPSTHTTNILAPSKKCSCASPNLFFRAPAALSTPHSTSLLHHHNRWFFWTAMNTEKYHPASSPATKQTSNGHEFHRKQCHYQLGTVFWWISRLERWILRNPASSLLRPWFPNSGIQTSPRPDAVYLRFINIDFGLMFPDWSLIRSWHNFSVGDTTHRTSLFKNTQISICFVIFHSNKQPHWWPNSDWDPVILTGRYTSNTQIWPWGSLNTQMDVCVSQIITKYANLGAQGSLNTQMDVRLTVSASYSRQIRKSGLQDA